MAFAATFAVVMSASSVRGVIQRVAETVMPFPETRFGASASAVVVPPSSDRPSTTPVSARRRGPANIDPPAVVDGARYTERGRSSRAMRGRLAPVLRGLPRRRLRDPHHDRHLRPLLPR